MSIGILKSSKSKALVASKGNQGKGLVGSIYHGNKIHNKRKNTQPPHHKKTPTIRRNCPRSFLLVHIARRMDMKNVISYKMKIDELKNLLKKKKIGLP